MNPPKYKQYSLYKYCAIQLDLSYYMSHTYCVTSIYCLNIVDLIIKGKLEYILFNSSKIFDVKCRKNEKISVFQLFRPCFGK